MKNVIIIILMIVLLVSCLNSKTNKNSAAKIQKQERDISISPFLQTYINNPLAKISLPYSFSNEQNPTKGTQLAGKINDILQKSGIGQSISIDIRSNKDSMIFNQDVSPIAYGIIKLDNYIVVLARSEAGEANDSYLFLMDGSGSITDHLKVRRTLGYFDDNRPLDFLQAQINGNGVVIVNEIIYTGNAYINIFKNDSSAFTAYRVNKKYKINEQGKFELIQSTPYAPKKFLLKDLYGVNIQDL